MNLSQRAITKNGKRMEVSLPVRARKLGENSEIKRKEIAREVEKDTVISPPKITKAPEVPYIEVQPLAEVTRHDPPKVNTKEGPAYKNIAPVEKDGLSQELLNRILNATLNTTVGELLGVAPELRKEVTKQVSKVRKPERQNTSRQFTAQIEDVSDSEDEPVREVQKELPSPQPISNEGDLNRIRVETLPGATYKVLTEDSDLGPKGAILVGDPVMQYLESLPPDQRKLPIAAAGNVDHLRTVFPAINSVGPRESILDSGSEIVSIPKRVASSLSLSWDPDIVMGMEGCHGDVETTLGLARNVPFEMGDTTLLLQCHVVKDAPYDVLLGRPFDIIARTVINNDCDDGTPTITITDPVTKKKTTFPTFERGKAPPGINQGRKQFF